MTKNNDTALLPFEDAWKKRPWREIVDEKVTAEYWFNLGYSSNTRPTAPQNAEALEALEAFETLEMIYQNHIEETLEEELPDDDETVFAAQECRRIIRAALNQPRTVKPLVWNDDGVNGFAYATTPLFFYEISLNDTQTHYTLTCDSDWIGDFKTIEEAKAAVEAHKDKMIREWLE